MFSVVEIDQFSNLLFICQTTFCNGRLAQCMEFCMMRYFITEANKFFFLSNSGLLNMFVFIETVYLLDFSQLFLEDGGVCYLK